MATHNASCQCGGLRVAAVRDPDIVIACNCRACQTRTGSAFATVAYFAKDATSIDGARKTWSRRADSGRGLENAFCPTCGTTVYWTLDFRPGHVGILVGALDAPLEPQRTVWTEEQLGWVAFPDHWESFPMGSPGS